VIRGWVCGYHGLRGLLLLLLWLDRCLGLCHILLVCGRHSDELLGWKILGLGWNLRLGWECAALESLRLLIEIGSLVRLMRWEVEYALRFINFSFQLLVAEVCKIACRKLSCELLPPVHAKCKQHSGECREAERPEHQSLSHIRLLSDLYSEIEVDWYG
jgi:hypothetical protein